MKKYIFILILSLFFLSSCAKQKTEMPRESETDTRETEISDTVESGTPSVSETITDTFTETSETEETTEEETETEIESEKITSFETEAEITETEAFDKDTAQTDTVDTEFLDTDTIDTDIPDNDTTSNVIDSDIVDTDTADTDITDTDTQDTDAEGTDTASDVSEADTPEDDPPEKELPIKVNEVCVINRCYMDQNYEYYAFIELYNSSDTTVNLAGYGFSLDIGDPYSYKFSNYLLRPKSYLLLLAKGKAGYHRGIISLPFTLSEEGGAIMLTSPDGISHIFTFPKLDVNESYARYEDGDEPVMYLTPTPLAPNREADVITKEGAENLPGSAETEESENDVPSTDTEMQDTDIPFHKETAESQE